MRINQSTVPQVWIWARKSLNCWWMVIWNKNLQQFQVQMRYQFLR